MNILTRYLFREVILTFRLFMLIFTVVLLVDVTYDRLGEILKNAPPLFYVIQLLIFSVPELLSQTFPMICMVSTIFSYGLLAKNKEILAMVASGVSFYRLAIPAVVFGVTLTAFTFWFNESVVPASVSQSRYIEAMIKGKKESVLTKSGDQLIKGKGNRFYYVENYDPKRNELHYPTIIEIGANGSGLSERIEAERAVLKTDKAGVTWGELPNAERWRFNADGTIARYEKLAKPLRIKIEEKLDVFLTKTKKPEAMNFGELSEYIDAVRQNGEDVDTARMGLQRKISFPLSCLLMALLGFAVVADVHARHFARGVTLGLLIAVGFYLLDGFLTGMVKKGSMQPILASWLPVLMFGVVVFVLLNRLKQIRS